MRGPRKIVERAQDVHEDAGEALNETRAKPCWPRGNVHVERRRDRSQVAASGTRDLGTIQKKAIQEKRRHWCRYTVAQTDGNRFQQQGYERRGGCLGQSVECEQGVGVGMRYRVRRQGGDYSTEL